jgi:hypothetical protein
VLPDRREALLLHHVWGFSFAEIGQLLGIRPGAAKLRSSRGMGLSPLRRADRSGSCRSRLRCCSPRLPSSGCGVTRAVWASS